MAVQVSLIKKYKIQPNKLLGQNFLLDEEVVEAMVDVAALQANNIVVEVGPGLGVLTKALVERVETVYAVEKDRGLFEILRTESVGDNLRLIHHDILKWHPAEAGLKPYQYKVVANLPYQITSACLEFFLSHETPPESITVMVQKEVGERVVAPAGKTSILSLSVQYFGVPEIVRQVPAESFWPVPKVESVILHISELEKTTAKHRALLSEDKFFRLAKHGFAGRRKMLKNNLAASYRVTAAEATAWLEQAGIKPTARAQELTMEEWFKLGTQLKH